MRIQKEWDAWGGEFQPYAYGPSWDRSQFRITWKSGHSLEVRNDWGSLAYRAITPNIRTQLILEVDMRNGDPKAYWFDPATGKRTPIKP